MDGICCAAKSVGMNDSILKLVASGRSAALPD